MNYYGVKMPNCYRYEHVTDMEYESLNDMLVSTTKHMSTISNVF